MRRWILPLALLIAGAALIAGLRIYNARADREVSSQLWIPKQVKITPELALLQQYVRIDTSNPPGNELPGARFLAALIEKNGVHAEIIESAPRRASVYARIAGKQHGDGLLLSITSTSFRPPGTAGRIRRSLPRFRSTRCTAAERWT
jgi:hypothetical protein